MIPLESAEKHAAELIQTLRRFALEIEVAGSVRRRRPLVHDIEIVMVPFHVFAWNLVRIGYRPDSRD